MSLEQDKNLEEEEKLTPAKMLAFFAMIVGMFMAVLDVQIVSSSLSVIAAGLSASGDELSWIQTAYLIAEVIIIPATGFLARLLSTRISYFLAAFGFTLMSTLCACAWDINSMIIFRAIQGLFGGAMIPTAFSAVFVIFPKSMHTKVTMVIGIVITMAPTLGPTLGGYITEYTSWHFMFLLNLIPGIFVCITVLLYVDFDKPNYKLMNNFDLKGLILMATSLGCLEYVLEEGNKKDWFDDTNIILLTIIVCVSFVWFVIQELTFRNPIISFKALRNRNFCFGCVYSFILGIGIYGSVYVLPLFLYTVAGYDTLQIGFTMIVAGLSQLISTPLAGKVFDTRLDKRIMLLIGFSLYAAGCFTNSFLTADSTYWEVFLPQVLRGSATMFCFMPINNLTLGSMPKEDIQDASGLYNLTRNLGGAIGLAVLNNIIATKSKLFEQAIKDKIASTSTLVADYINMYTQMLTGKVILPEKAAYKLLMGAIEKEAFIMSINNAFFAIGLSFCIGILLIPFASTKNLQKVSVAH